METIKFFENEERFVKLIFDEFDNTYTVTLLTRAGKNKAKVYKSAYWALRKFSEFKCYPFKALGV